MTNDQPAGTSDRLGFGAFDVDLVTGESVGVPDVRVDFTINEGSAILSSPWCVTDESGGCYVDVLSYVPGTVIVAASVDGQEVIDMTGQGTGSPVTLRFIESAAPSESPTVATASTPPASSTASATQNPTSTPTSATSGPATSSPSSAVSESMSAPETTGATSVLTPTESGSVPTPLVVYGMVVTKNDQPVGTSDEVTFGAIDENAATPLTSGVAGVRADFTVDEDSASLSAPWCVTDATGTCTVTVTSTQAGSVMVSAFVDGQEIVGIPGYYGSPVMVTFVDAASPSETPSTSPAATTSTIQVPTQSAALETSAPETSAPVTPNPAASVPATHGVYYGMSAVLDGQAAGGTPDVIQFGAYGVDYVTTQTSAVPGVRADFTLDSGSATMLQSWCVTDETGMCTVAVMSSQAGTVVVHGFVDDEEVTGVPLSGAYSSPVQLTFAAPVVAPPASTAPASSAPTSTAPITNPITSPTPGQDLVTHGVYYGVSAAVDGQPAGGTPNMVGFAAMDADYLTAQTTPVSGVRVDFSIESGAGIMPQSWCVTDETGECGVPVMSTAAGTVLVKAVVDGQEVTGIPQVGTYASPVTLTFAAPALTAPIGPDVTAPTGPQTTVPGGPEVTVNISTLAAGSTVVVSGDGWVPGESVLLTIHSDSVDLGTVTANTDGTLPDVTFFVPAGLEVGEHTIMAVGSLSGSAESTFVVPGAGLSTSAPQASVPQSTVPVSGVSVPTGGNAAVMPSVAGLVIALASIGLGVLLTKKQRRKI